MTVQRGDVVIVDFDATDTASMTKKRPAVVIQNNTANRFSPYTIIAAVRNDSGKNLPVQVKLPAGVGGLTKDSVADLGYIATLPTSDILSVIGRLGPTEMAMIDNAIRFSLAVR